MGNRLVLANGIIFLAFMAGALIVVFHGDTHALIPLFAVGAFLAFTLSQTGMVAHWRSERGKYWLIKALLNGLGALVTGITVMVVAVSKFSQGAWLTILLIPTIVAVFYWIRGHYRNVAEQLTLSTMELHERELLAPRVVIPISGVHRGVADAVIYALSISRDVTAVYIEMEPDGGSSIREKWDQCWPDVPLVILPSPYRSLVGPLLDYFDRFLERFTRTSAISKYPFFYNSTAGRFVGMDSPLWR